jgi:hypothetical protein
MGSLSVGYTEQLRIIDLSAWGIIRAKIARTRLWIERALIRGIN